MYIFFLGQLLVTLKDDENILLVMALNVYTGSPNGYK